MRFFDRHRRFLSALTLAVTFGATLMAPATASAEYNPKTGRWLQRDPNGMGLNLTSGLRYHGDNPIVTVSMAYELQYGDGMNFYEFLRSNAPNRLDPNDIGNKIGSVLPALSRVGDIELVAVLGHGSTGYLDALVF